jgi:hypothetical protein
MSTYLDVPQGQLAANCIAEALHCKAWRAIKYVSCRPVSTPTDKAFDIAEQEAKIKLCQRAETQQNRGEREDMKIRGHAITASQSTGHFSIPYSYTYRNITIHFY